MPYLLPYWVAGGWYSPHLSGSGGSASRGIRTVCRLAGGIGAFALWVLDLGTAWIRAQLIFLATVGGWCVGGGGRSLVIFAATKGAALKLPP